MARRTTNVTHGTSGTPEPDPYRSAPTPPTDPGYEDPHLRATGGHGHDDPDDDHYIPDRTIPQGTQWHAVDGGHEERDVNVPALIRWGIGLLILTAGTCLFLFGAFAVALNQEKSAPRPSTVMMQPTVPPYPRVIPNRLDHADREALAGGKKLPIQDPIAYHEELKELEAPEIAALGLMDLSTKLPVLPQGAVEAVNAMNAQGGASAPATHESDRIEWQAPSDMSGGVSNEDRLR